MLHFRFFTAAVVLVALPFLSACAFGSSASQATRFAPSASAGRSLPLDARSFPTVNQAGKSVTFYAARAEGNVAPLATISGDNTGLTSPTFVARDAGGRIYVADYLRNAVFVFAAGADGNVAPIQIIAGGRTGLYRPRGIALHRSLIYVANDERGASRINVYGAGGDGDVAPIGSIRGSNTGLDVPAGLAVDEQGNVYASNLAKNTITVYAPDENGNVAPIRTIGGSNTQLENSNGVALDSAGRIYVAAAPEGKAQKLLVFAAGADGNAKPTQLISGAKTLLQSPSGVAVTAGEIYVANFSNPGSSIAVYPAGANGDVAPVRRIVGSKTLLSSPLGILAP
jgi:DNA-binding beta-propeller fold protein YncE